MITRYQHPAQKHMYPVIKKGGHPESRIRGWRGSRLNARRRRRVRRREPWFPPRIKNRPEGATALTNGLTGNYRTYVGGINAWNRAIAGATARGLRFLHRDESFVREIVRTRRFFFFFFFFLSKILFVIVSKILFPSFFFFLFIDIGSF